MTTQQREDEHDSRVWQTNLHEGVDLRQLREDYEHEISELMVLEVAIAQVGEATR